jgi:putative redox protein
MIQVEWRGKMAFEARMPDGTGFLMDTDEASGGESGGASPVQALLAAVAGGAGMDVISILRKMRQEVTAYRMEVEHARAPQGEFPRPVTAIRVRHLLEGPNLDEAAVAKAVRLSDEKYCSVLATLRFGPAIESEFRIAAPASPETSE